ncbi:ribosomal protein S19 binding protein 1 [Colossoma macropomum]|uniref:ribosomal protein S19 binding protein 1 n=1 Tax=Colossoma macropomum TaxID=42526 RepID=UPI001863BC41|nr:ribosomal protein S19 binding protein 1 [Colossoma macropomum]
MSASMIRKGLELLSNDLKDAGKSHKKSSQKVSVMDQISSNKKGVRKQIRRLQAHSRAAKSKTTVKDKRVKNALEEYRKKQKKSQLKSNLKYFLGTSYKINEHHTKTILKQNTGRLSRHQPDKPVKKPQEKSIFTEEEFQRFQEEYFSNL